MTGGLALLLVAQAALWPEMDPLVQKGYDHFYNLEYPEAIATFRRRWRRLRWIRTGGITWPRPCCSA